MTRRLMQEPTGLGRRLMHGNKGAKAARRRRLRRWLRYECLESRHLLNGVTLMTHDWNFGVDGCWRDGSSFPSDVSFRTMDSPAPESRGIVFGEARLISSSADGARPVFAADLDGDADADVLWGSVGGDMVMWSENDGSGGFGPERVVATGLDQVNSGVAADMDGDGDLDVVAAASRGWSAPVVWYENQGGGSSFTQHPIGTTAWGTVSVAAGDVDRDGDLDVLTATLYAGNGLRWYENTGGGRSFTAHDLPASYAEAHDVFAADLDRDGDLDVLAAFASGNALAWYQNDGHQGFTEHTISNSAVSARSVVAVDLDRDGDLDVLSASYGDDKMAWYANDGHQNFTEHQVSTSLDGAFDTIPADLDGDGDWDMVSAGSNGNTVVWHENDGEQNFASHVVSTDVSAVWSVFVSDIDRDGDPDVLSASGSEGANDSQVAWYENRPTLVADAGGLYSGKEGSPITFEASNPSDAEGGALQYRWDFDNDGIWDTGYSGAPTAAHTWLDDHTGIVAVEVTDGRFTARDTATVAVQNVAPGLVEPVLLDEDFSSDVFARGWRNTAPDQVQWVPDGGYLDAWGNDQDYLPRWAYSPTFESVQDRSFVFQFDMRPTVTSWGTYPQVDLVQEQLGNPLENARLMVNAHWSDAGYNKFLLYDASGGDALHAWSPTFDTSKWYHHTLAYDASLHTLRWEVTQWDDLPGGTKTPFHAGEYSWLPSAFNQVALGYQGEDGVYGHWAEMYVDNVRLETGAGGSGVAVTPTVVDEGGTVTLSGSFVDPGILDTHAVTIDWGDGAISTHPLATGQRNFEVTHVYADDDPSGTSSDRHVLGVKITDDDGGSDYSLGWNGEVTVPPSAILWETDLNSTQTSKNVITRVQATADGSQVAVFHHTFTGLSPVERLDAQTGQIVWFGATNVPSGMSGTGWVDADGNLYLTSVWGGYTVSKYDADLNHQWTYPGGSGFEYVWDLTTDAAGNVYATGYTGSWVGQGSRVVKLNSQGQEIWTSLSLYGGADHYCNGIALDSQGNVFRVGMDNPGDNIGRGRLLGHLAADGREFLSVAVAEPDSLIGGVIVDANDDLYIAYTYDRGLSGQEKTVVQKLDQQGHVLWEFRFDAAGMRVNRKALANSGRNTFLLAYEQDQDGTAYPGLAEFTYDGQLVWMKTIDRPGWDVTFAGLSSTADMVYVGLNNQADQQQSKVMAVQTDLPLIVTVNNVAPAVEIHGASASVSRGTPVSLTAAVTDPGTQDTYTYVWSVTRDGQPYPIEGPADQPGFAFIPVDGGIYQVALMVADDDGGVAMDTATFDVADAVPVEIIVGDHRLLPNRANQEITIVATGVTDVTGLNLRAQLGDGGGLLPEPVFGGVEFGGGIWDSHPYTVMGGAVGGLEQFLQASVAFNETGRSVPAGGVIVTLLVDTTGFFEGQFDLRLAGTEIGADTAFVLAGGVELPVSIRNGSVTIAAAEVVGVYAFYNNSPFDGHDPASNANDDRAIATDKHPLRPGQTATFANYTSYVRGLNGMMVDIAGLPAGGLDAASFEFRVGNTQDPSDWPFGPTPEGITVRRGAGVGGSDRVTLIWPDSAIVGCWLQVTVGPTMETGLALPYVFYFGNAPGESGNSRTDTFVDAVDFVGVRDHPRDFLHPATTDVVFDFNRDGLVDGTDLAIVRDHPTNFVTALKLVDFRVHTVSSSEPLPGSSVSIAAMFDVTSGGPLSAPTLTVQGLVSTPVPPRALVDAWDAPPTILSQAAAEVIPSWRNPAQATDVTGDGQVTVLDALSIIRHLEAQAFPRLPDAPAKPHPYVDVNGDGLCTPLDVLWVINSIPARTPGLPEGEARPEGAPVARSERLPTISLGPTPTSDRLPRLSPPESDVRPANRSVTSLVGQIPVKVLDVRPSKLSHAAALPVPVAHRDRDEPTPRFIDSADWELDAVLEEVAPDVARVLSGQT